MLLSFSSFSETSFVDFSSSLSEGQLICSWIISLNKGKEEQNQRGKRILTLCDSLRISMEAALGAAALFYRRLYVVVVDLF